MDIFGNKALKEIIKVREMMHSYDSYICIYGNITLFFKNTVHLSG